MLIKIQDSFLKKFKTVGQMVLMLQDIFFLTVKGRYDWQNTINVLHEIGVKSFPIIVITSFATGMVLALQLGIVMQNWFGYPLFVGMTVSFSFAKELSPILVSIVMAGRIGAAITAEIGTMKVTEQIDALSSLGAHPIQYLAVPRFVGCIIMVPLLSLLGYGISLLGGLLVSVAILKLPSTVYLNDALETMYVSDILHGIIKAFFFAGIISWVSIFKGFTCEEGAEGVGKATTNAVVLSIILILISDYFLTAILVSLGIGNGN